MIANALFHKFHELKKSVKLKGDKFVQLSQYLAANCGCIHTDSVYTGATTYFPSKIHCDYKTMNAHKEQTDELIFNWFHDFCVFQFQTLGKTTQQLGAQLL